MDLTRTTTNNRKRMYEVNQSTSTQQLDINQITEICNNADNLDQNNLEQFENAVCNVQNGISITYDRKTFKDRPKISLFCSYCSSHGHTKAHVLKNHNRNLNRDHEKDQFTDT